MKKEKAARLAENLIAVYKRVPLSRSAAGLSYFLMLTIFPLLICLYTMLGSLFPTDEDIMRFLTGIIPTDSIGLLIDDYLSYVSMNNSRAMLTAAIAAMATSSAAAFRTIHHVMGEMRGVRRFDGVFSFLFSFVFSLIFLATIYVSAIIILTGSWFLSFVDEHVPFLDISSSWSWLRFILLFFLLFVILTGVYRITAPRGCRVKLLPGALFSAIALVGVSILFSFFIGMSAKYPVVYGSLASVMIMMIWLYICGFVLLAGNVVNVALENMEAEQG